MTCRTALMIASCTCLLVACGTDINLSPDAGAMDNADGGVRPLRVFVTSRLFRGNFGGLNAADQACQQAAAAQNLPGTFKAYLSAATENAVDRQSPNGSWAQHRSDGQVLLTFTSRANLRTTPLVPIRITEAGSELATDGGQVIWTGTMGGGASFVNGTQAVNCADWTTAENAGVAGLLGATDDAWTAAKNSSGNPSAVHCGSEARLLCLEQ